jgi:drug/metabolite transporter (DMT)-like permease
LGALLDRLIGVFLVALSAACFGVNPIFARMAFGTGANPGTFLFIRYAIASVLMVVILAAKQLNYPKGRPLAVLILAGILGLGGSTFCYFTALTLAPVSLVVVITYMYPALVSLFPVVFLKEDVSYSKIAGLFLTLLGIAFTAAPFSRGEYLGIVFSMITAIVYALFLIFGNAAIHEAGLLPASTVIVVSATLAYGAVVAIQGAQWPMGPIGWGATVASALISTVSGLVCLLAGLRRIDTANAAMISTFEVVVSIALAVIVLKEAITWSKAVGAALIILVVLFLAKSEYKRARIDLFNRDL